MKIPTITAVKYIAATLLGSGVIVVTGEILSWSDVRIVPLVGGLSAMAIWLASREAFLKGAASQRDAPRANQRVVRFSLQSLMLAVLVIGVYLAAYLPSRREIENTHRALRESVERAQRAELEYRNRLKSIEAKNNTASTD